MSTTARTLTKCYEAMVANGFVAPKLEVQRLDPPVKHQMCPWLRAAFNLPAETTNVNVACRVYRLQHVFWSNVLESRKPTLFVFLAAVIAKRIWQQNTETFIRTVNETCKARGCGHDAKRFLFAAAIVCGHRGVLQHLAEANPGQYGTDTHGVGQMFHLLTYRNLEALVSITRRAKVLECITETFNRAQRDYLAPDDYVIQLVVGKKKNLSGAAGTLKPIVASGKATRVPPPKMKRASPF